MKEKEVKKYDDPYSEYGMTREEIGKRLGVSRQTVADIEKRVIKKLRKALSKAGIKKDDYI